MAKPSTRLIRPSELAAKGVPWGRTHLRRLVKAGKFPAPIYPSERRPCWVESEIDEWITKRGAKREVERAEYARKRQTEIKAKHAAKQEASRKHA